MANPDGGSDLGSAARDHDGWSPGLDAHDGLGGRSSGLGPEGWRRADAALRDRIVQHLLEDRILDARRIEVWVEEGVVTLAGQVAHASDVKLAEMLALEVGPKAEVRNRLREAG
jgi:osmotically-inducible protein OsmY